MGYLLEETLYEDEARTTVVKEGDPRARFLVGVAGQTLPDDEAARLGLRDRQAPAAPERAAVPTSPAAKVKAPAEAKVVIGPDVSPKERR